MSVTLRCPRTGLMCRENCKTPECLGSEPAGEKARRISHKDPLDAFLQAKAFESKQMNPHPIVASLRWLATSLERGEVTWESGGLFISKTDGGYSVQGELELADVEPEDNGTKLDSLG